MTSPRGGVVAAAAVSPPVRAPPTTAVPATEMLRMPATTADLVRETERGTGSPRSLRLAEQHGEPRGRGGPRRRDGPVSARCPFPSSSSLDPRAATRQDIFLQFSETPSPTRHLAEPLACLSVTVAGAAVRWLGSWGWWSGSWRVCRL